MLLTNLSELKDVDYEIIGLVEGSSVFSKHLGKDFMAGLKNMVGGEVKSYTEMIDGAKSLALSRLEQSAISQGADAVLNVTYSTTNLQTGAALVVNVVGTAVKYK